MVGKGDTVEERALRFQGDSRGRGKCLPGAPIALTLQTASRNPGSRQALAWQAGEGPFAFTATPGRGGQDRANQGPGHSGPGRQAIRSAGRGKAGRRWSSRPRPSWKSWLLRSISPSCARRRASSPQVSGSRRKLRLLSKYSRALPQRRLRRHSRPRVRSRVPSCGRSLSQPSAVCNCRSGRARAAGRRGGRGRRRGRA